jgi:hypothetical protein
MRVCCCSLVMHSATNTRCFSLLSHQHNTRVSRSPCVACTVQCRQLQLQPSSSLTNAWRCAVSSDTIRLVLSHLACNGRSVEGACGVHVVAHAPFSYKVLITNTSRAAHSFVHFFSYLCACIASRRYKFCVAMENSISVDYVTEKIWDALSAGEHSFTSAPSQIGDRDLSHIWDALSAGEHLPVDCPRSWAGICPTSGTRCQQVSIYPCAVPA